MDSTRSLKESLIVPRNQREFLFLENPRTPSQASYLASIEVSNDLDNDLLVLIRSLISRYHHFSCGQVLQLIDLDKRKGRGRGGLVSGIRGLKKRMKPCWD